MTKNHEQELLIQLKSYLEPAVKVGLYNVQTLLNRNYQCIDLEVKSQYPTELALSMRENIVTAKTQYQGSFNTNSITCFEHEDVENLLMILMGQQDEPLIFDDFGLSAFGEIVSSFQSGFTQSLSGLLSKNIHFERPETHIITAKDAGLSPFSAKVFTVTFIVEYKSGQMPVVIHFDYNSITQLLDQPLNNTNSIHNIPKINGIEEVQVKELRVPKFTPNNDTIQNADPQKNLNLIMNVPLNVSVEIGKTKHRIKDVMNFAAGYVLELDKPLGAPVDIVVNGQLIARGDVVVIDENFAIRVTEVINTQVTLSND